MSDAGLFDLIINFLIKRTGKEHYNRFDRGSVNNFCGTFRRIWCNNILIVVPAFYRSVRKWGSGPEALLAAMCGGYGVMNLVPWGGPTMRAASVANIEVG